jgi:hypothetical protein
MERMVHCLEAAPSNSSSPPQSGAPRNTGENGKFGNQMVHRDWVPRGQEEARALGKVQVCFPGSSVVWWPGKVTSPRAKRCAA